MADAARPRPRGGLVFALRWSLAITASVLLAGAVEYAFASRQLADRILAASLASHVSHAEELEDLVAGGLDGDPELMAEIEHELEAIEHGYGIELVTLFDRTGAPIAGTGDWDALDAHAVAAVRETGEAFFHLEAEEGETSARHRYEFVIPVNGPDGVLILEVDQNAEIVGDLLADLRLRKAFGTLAVALLAIPLSYLAGGRALHRRQRHAEHVADTDALTGIAGRRPFRPQLEALLDRATGQPVALALIDIDEFKQVNDRLGHSYGDRVLVAMAEALGELRGTDLPFRLGGDEFAVLLPGSDDTEASAVTERVRRRFVASAPGITFSCGIASASPDEATTTQELWERADSALYESKRQGRRRTTTFTQVANRVCVTPEKLEALERLLRGEVAPDVAFQPVWALEEGRLIAHEALLRIPVDLPLDGPAEAFALAERLGVVEQLDTLARNAVLVAVGSLPWEGALALNVHPDAVRALDVDGLVADVVAAGLTPAQVILEVTEHAALERPEDVGVLQRAQKAGFLLALDDLGAGNAGLRALAHVRFDVVKVDRSVTARLGLDPAADATVAAARAFAASTGGWIVAEGIEDSLALRALLGPPLPGRAGGAVIAGQGYLIGRPEASPRAALDVPGELRAGLAPPATDQEARAGLV